ncbi:uncharacterized protein LOC130436556 [Triplophysa dalaica]|uniref:uncharacterized protein LOC130436556 n=1 Tax=Triplophysa dalaica TaxID=1582913 RepID=UPI0024E016FD|nr:uncharacterized protein LOC130436556 [Triplophysa dalaica]
MANFQSLKTSEEGVAPSSLLEQSLEDLASGVSFPSLSHLRSPDSTEDEEAVPWMHLTSDHLAVSLANTLEVFTDVPLHQSEALSETCEETLSDFIAACFPEFFQPSDQTHDIIPVNTSHFYSGHQEAKHGHSIPTAPSIRDPHSWLPNPPAHPTPQRPAVMLDVTRANTPHFICVPQPNPTSSQLHIDYTPLGANHSCPMHGAIPLYPFSPSRVFPSHLSVVTSNPAAQQPWESLDRDKSWRTHVMTSAGSLHENFSVWQRFCETAKEFYSNSPHVQALTCFFIHEIDSLTVLHSGYRFDAAVKMAIHKWDKKSLSEREKYYTSAKMFIKLEEEERRFIQHRFQTNKPRGQHSGLRENPEVKDRSEVSEGSIR